MLLGCIADDFTGATDLANTLSRRGMRTVQTIGVPDGAAPDADAIVVALKSRTIEPALAVTQSLAACRWLKKHGARQIYFKYCSTFDSTDRGNIGPVADALLDELNADFTIACPAFPENGRTIYRGNLFVGDVLVSESSMRHHPLTPMLDSNLVNVLAPQTPHRTGLVPYRIVKKGAAAITNAFSDFRKYGTRHAIVDAIEDVDLQHLGEACANLALVTGGSGAALDLPENFCRAGLLAKRDSVSRLASVGGRGVVLSGSCSTATLAQVKAMAAKFPAREIDIVQLASNKERLVAEIVSWALSGPKESPVLIYASAPPEKVLQVQAQFGREQAGTMIETAMAAIAKDLSRSDVRRFVVAGGETSGAVVSSLGVNTVEIGPQIAAGVPATLSFGETRHALALKSGNFGGPEFFKEALDALK
jgi:3-dehydrotetronate 4-kinase